MARTLSTTARQELFKRSSGMVLPILIEIAHPSFSTIRLVNNNVALTYNSNVYSPFAFRFDPPDESDSGVPGASLTIDAVDQSIVTLIRTTSTSPTLTVRAMFYYDNGTLTFEPLVPWTFLIRNVTYNADVLTCSLIYDDRLDNQMGTITMSAQVMPGIF